MSHKAAGEEELASASDDSWGLLLRGLRVLGVFRVQGLGVEGFRGL